VTPSGINTSGPLQAWWQGSVAGAVLNNKQCSGAVSTVPSFFSFQVFVIKLWMTSKI